MFIAYEVSLDLIRELRTVVPVIASHDRELASQIRNAASSVTLNLSQGQRSGGGNQKRHYAIAHGSANEVKGALAVAETWGWIDGAARSREILDRLLALLWKLTRTRA